MMYLRVKTAGLAALAAALLLLPAGPARADLDGAINDYYAANYDAAAQEFQRLADAGDGEAQLWLGYLYTTGEGVAQNYGEAQSWYERSVDNGNAKALSFIGDLYYYGHGPEKDLVAAAR